LAKVLDFYLVVFRSLCSLGGERISGNLIKLRESIKTIIVDSFLASNKNKVSEKGNINDVHLKAD
jgi:hypothetical protein